MSNQRSLALALGACLPLVVGANCDDDDSPPEPTRVERDQPPAPELSHPFARERARLLAGLRAEGIGEVVLDALARVPRHSMVPESFRDAAYEDRALPIGHDQTISQPFVVALMTQLAEIEPADKVLEIGTGSGYQAAVLAELGADVYSIEIVEPLATRTRALLDEIGYPGIQTRVGDGYLGWPEEAPFDAILITAAPPAIPEPLKRQLAVGGKLVAPVGRDQQELVILTRTERGIERERSIPVRFVPMVGEAQEPE